MGRKTYSFSAAAMAAAATFSFASAEVSGAFAQAFEPGAEQLLETDALAQGSTSQTQTAAGTPVFVAEEVVQPLPEASSETAQDNADITAASSLRELVSQTDTDFALSEQMRCLAGAIYFEARGEPLAGQLAVAQVVINRTDSTRFPDTYCRVVKQRAQFSFVKNGRIPTPRTGSRAWERAKAIARIAHESQWESEAADALYFHAKYVSPSWSRKKIARATINQHIFYR